MTKIDKKLKRKWVAALRSGAFKQAQHALFDKYTTFGYCCLGVLAVQCGASLSEHGDLELGGEPVKSDGAEYLRKGFVKGLNRETQEYLGNMNDGRALAGVEVSAPRDFNTIADWIEKNL